MNQKERLRDIKRKHEQEQYRRRIFIHRLVFAASAAAVILVLVFAVKGLTSYISDKAGQKRAEKPAAASETPAPTRVVIENPNKISMNYYASSAFIGNSFVEGMIIYDLIDGTDYFTKIGLTVNDALTKCMDNSPYTVIEEINRGKRYNSLFMMFGENELGWVNPETFITQYGVIIDKAKQYQPQSKIYLLAITPVTKKVSEKNVDNTTNERIAEYNELIKKLAEDKGVVYADIHSAVKDADGVLPEGAASDGVHFGEEYYKKCLLYIQNNIQR